MEEENICSWCKNENEDLKQTCLGLICRTCKLAIEAKEGEL